MSRKSVNNQQYSGEYVFFHKISILILSAIGNLLNNSRASWTYFRMISVRAYSSLNNSSIVRISHPLIF